MARQTHIQFSIPEPCKVPWDGMSPVDAERRHCSSCDKVITNFSEMSDDELMLYFRHSRQNICGVFSNDQLNRRIKLLPEKTQKASWWKIMLLIPLSFFSKSARAQYFHYVNAVKQSHVAVDTSSNPVVVENKIDTTEIVEIEVDSFETPVAVVLEKTESFTVDSVIANAPEPDFDTFSCLLVISGVMIQTMGDVYIKPQPSIWHISFWDMFYRKSVRLTNGDTLDKPNTLNIYVNHKEEPQPEKPALPSSTEISAIMPIEDRKNKRSW